MKKRILALVGALVLTMGMSLNVCAAPSSTASSNSSTTTTTTTTTNTSSSVADEKLATTTQQFTSATIAEFAKTTTIKDGVTGATISVVSDETAAAAIAQAKAVVDDNAFVAAVVDLKVPAGTGAATFTLGCPNVWAGQKVVILHQKADGTWETIKPSKVANNEVTFTLTSYSPVAIVIDTTAAKTGDVTGVVATAAIVCLAGAVVFGRKKAAN